QLGQLERRREAVLHRQLLVAGDRLEAHAPSGKFLGELAPPLVLLDRTLLCHFFELLAFPRLSRPSAAHCRNGKLNPVDKARGSSSVFAVVHTTMSMPQISVALS